MATQKQGFLGDLDEAFKQEIDPFYRGSERSFNAALSLGIAQGAMHGPMPAQSVTQFLEGEFLRRGYGTDIAGAATTALANSITQNNYADVLGRLQKAGDHGSLPALVTLGTLHLYGKAGLPQSASLASGYYRSAANAGDATALFNMGVLHWTGQGVEQSKSKAIDYFRRAADQEDSPALFNMGILHYHGDGVDQSFGKAFNFFWRAMKQGDTDAAVSLGRMHHRGLGTEVSLEKAMICFRFAAEYGDVQTQYNLGLGCLHGEGLPQDINEAVKWIRIAAEKGLGDAQKEFGILCRDGTGVEQSYEEAFRWFVLAGNQHQPDAQFEVGRQLQSGLGHPKNVQLAEQWYRAAANQNHTLATYVLGNLCAEQGRDNEAVQFFSTAINQGFTEAFVQLGRLFEAGRTGGAPDPSTAHALYLHAAKAGSMYGQFHLGHLIMDHYKNSDQAEPWLLKAAERGHLHAQNSLGLLYVAKGRDVEAENWLGLAASRGLEAAIDNYRAVFKREPAVRPDCGSLPAIVSRYEP
jgi:uncharacterized protein